jgi:beta-lactam-binding protein with PASTA domain
MQGNEALTATFALKPVEAVCLVPNVKGKRLPAAKRALARAHCRLGKVTRAYSRAKKKGIVVSQKPRPGTRHTRGTRVSLVVSKGRRS